MTRSKHWFVIHLSFFSISALVLTACGAFATPVSPRPTTVPPTAAPTAPPATQVQVGKVDIEVFSWWTTGGEAAGFQKLIDDFNSQNPHAEVINAAVAGGSGGNARTILKARLLAGDPPDSFQVHMGHELIDTWVTGSQNYMEPLDDVYKQYGFTDVFPKNVLDIVSANGHPWSVPVNIHRANVLWFNKSVLKNAGIATAPVTWDEFFADADTLKAAGITPLALGDNGPWAAKHLFETILIGALGPDGYDGLWTGATKWTDPKVTGALTIFGKALTYVNADHGQLSWDQANQLVIDGKAAFTIMGDWVDGDYAAKGFTDYGWAPVPQTQGVYDALSDSFGLPKGAPHPEQVKKFLGILGSKAGQETFNKLKGSICARTDCDYSTFDTYLQSSAADWKTDIIVPSLTHGAAANDGWSTSIEEIVSKFVASPDIASAQAGLVQAAAQNK